MSNSGLKWSTSQAIERRAIVAYIILASVISLVALTFVLTDFELSGDTFIFRTRVLIVVAACGWFARGFGMARTSALLEALAIMAGFAIPTFLACALLAASGFPLIDAQLIAMDRLLAFDWLSLIDMLKGYPAVFDYGEVVYRTLTWQPTLLVVLLALMMRHLHLWRFITAWFVTLALTMLIFPFTPAVGGFIHYGIDHTDLPFLSEAVISGWHDIFAGIRDGTVTSLGSNTITGIVTFPSFHAAGAVLLGYGYMAINWLRWPMLVLNIGVFFSSIFIGGHYLVDVIAGGLIAVVAILIVKRLPYLRDEDQPQPANDRSG